MFTGRFASRSFELNKFARTTFPQMKTAGLQPCEPAPTRELRWRQRIVCRDLPREKLCN